MAGNLKVTTANSFSDLRTRVRRSDREITEQAKIFALLERGTIGFIATALDDQPCLNPNLYWYDPGTQRIYFYTAIKDRTRSNIERNQNVCFSVAEMGDLLPADTALEFSTEYACVIVFGKCILLESEQQRHTLQGLLDKYFPALNPDVDYRAITDDELTRTSVFAIEIESWSGKEKSSKA